MEPQIAILILYKMNNYTIIMKAETDFINGNQGEKEADEMGDELLRRRRIERVLQGIIKVEKIKIERLFYARRESQLKDTGLTCRKRRRKQHEQKIGRPREVKRREQKIGRPRGVQE